jgi:hypothetical protein
MTPALGRMAAMALRKMAMRNKTVAIDRDASAPARNALSTPAEDQ